MSPSHPLILSPLNARAFRVTGGPWISAFCVELPTVASKSNFRRYSAQGSPDRAKWERYKSFEAELRQVLLAYRPDDWEVGERTDPVEDRPVVVVSLWARSRLDTANLDKSVLDAGQPAKVDPAFLGYLTKDDVPVCWNDASVRALLPCSERGDPHPDEAGAVIGYACLKPGTGTRALIDAVHTLAVESLGRG